MDKNTIYQKSAKGLEEMSSRTYKLPARERSVLIMVDGKSTAQEVIDKAKHFGDAEHFFQTLVENGFIEPTAVPAMPAPAASVPSQAPVAPAPAQAPTPAPSEKSLAAAKDFASHYLTRVIGPDADPMSVKIEGCKTPAELVQLVEKYREVVKSFGGSRRAEEFASGTTARLP